MLTFDHSESMQRTKIAEFATEAQISETSTGPFLLIADIAQWHSWMKMKLLLTEETVIVCVSLACPERFRDSEVLLFNENGMT